MKQYKKPMLIAATIGSIGAATIGGSAFVNAQSNGQNDGGLVDKIAQKFNLNKDDVQAVFDQNRSEHEAERKQKMDQRLDKAVADGKITSAQKDLIVSKQEEMKSFHDSLKGKSASDRKIAMKQKMDELKQWAKDNDIPEGLLHPFKHGGPGGPPDDRIENNVDQDDKGPM